MAFSQENLATKADLSDLRLATNADLQAHALLTKTDLQALALATKGEWGALRAELNAIEGKLSRMLLQCFFGGVGLLAGAVYFLYVHPGK